MGELHRIILCEHKSCRFEHSENLCFLRKPVFSPPTEKKQVAEAVGSGMCFQDQNLLSVFPQSSGVSVPRNCLYIVLLWAVCQTISTPPVDKRRMSTNSRPRESKHWQVTIVKEDQTNMIHTQSYTHFSQLLAQIPLALLERFKPRLLKRVYNACISVP